MGIWAWIQPVDRIWKVVTDAEKGMLCVYNEKNELIQENKGLTKEEVYFIEQNFLEIVATNLSEDKTAPPHVVDIAKPEPEFNYMYA
ncbi:MAG: hypothetical protein O8C62_08530 [Candidatus Methanoperedens sp.]|nr:hypothetical protein [Candidatus Methanoperedens sp.]